MDFGAVANNRTDIGPALMKAFECAQKSITKRAADTVILVPPGNYRWASKVVFAKSQFITVTIRGRLYMPYDPKLTRHLNVPPMNSRQIIRSSNIFLKIIFNGNGRLYGNGNNYRPGRNLNLHPNRPRLIRFERCDTVDYSGVDLYDAPLFHLVFSHGKNIRIHHFEIHCLYIGATDGINVSGSNIYVHDVVVENGDELTDKANFDRRCVTAKSPIIGLKVRNVQCIGTTGCAIGSMGPTAKDYRIENLDYRNVTVSNGANGVVIKSYPGASGIISLYPLPNQKRDVLKLQIVTDKCALDILSSFTLIAQMKTNVAYPIKLDYMWGATLHKTRRQKPVEEIQRWSGMTFNDFSGTGTKNRAPVTLNCPGRSPCTGLQLTGSTKTTVVSNACGRVDSKSRKTIPNLPPC
ncbi:family 28 glycoside hydrolase [Melampsora larici-populina 98AG31]|uniref:Family 28 glycoside hydrolase n=1 Tax=Melampsora larici-populina (strain 98AG31 / pathotype 3-4-7) TaxID=747676 RepID=F4R4Y5_MELLP|nr:family 28 glycoside hydrolase [Melampsora larici-populina 98AG31]EGG12912.1 family 28 glycoside hydrolase [Melampsora larici-populina 98AG31]